MMLAAFVGCLVLSLQEAMHQCQVNAVWTPRMAAGKFGVFFSVSFVAAAVKHI